jgi:hypothetical protein
VDGQRRVGQKEIRGKEITAMQEQTPVGKRKKISGNVGGQGQT